MIFNTKSYENRGDCISDTKEEDNHKLLCRIGDLILIVAILSYTCLIIQKIL